MEIGTTFNHLQDELNQAKEKLKGVDENIKRFLGRDPNESPVTPKTGIKRTANNQLDDPSGRRRSMLPPGRRREFSGHKDEDGGPPPNKRRISEGNVFSRLSGPVRSRRDQRDMGSGGEEEEYGFRPSIQSQVIATPKDDVSRQDVVAAQNADEKSKARNRRMFGALLGTLQKFRQEETRMKDKEDKRAKVEEKLEEAARNEKEQIRHEKIALFNDRKKKQQEIKKIEYKMYRMKEQEDWESKQLLLKNFIKTKAKPPIFFLPKSHTPRTLQLLEASKDQIEKDIEEKRQNLQNEMELVERQGKGRQDRNNQDFGERKQRPWRERRQDKPRQDKSESANMEQQLDEDSDLEGMAGPELDDGVGAGKEGEEEGEEEGGEVENGVKEQTEEMEVDKKSIVENQAADQVKSDSPSHENSKSPQTGINVDENQFEPVYD